MRDREEMKDGVGRASAGGHAGDRVLESLLGEDVVRHDIFLQKLHHEMAHAARERVFLAGGGRHARAAHRRDPQEFAGRRHRVRGELSAAGAHAGTRRLFHAVEILFGDLAGIERADRFVHVLNGNIVAFVAAGANRAAIQHQAGNVQPRQRHHRAGNGLVATGERDNAVEIIRARHQFDGIGNHFAANQRSAHSVGAHRDAVRDRDRVELHRSAARLANPFLDRRRRVSRRW